MNITTNKVEYVTITAINEMAVIDDLLIHFTGDFTIGDTDISLISIRSAITTLEKELLDYKDIDDDDDDTANKLHKALTILKKLDSNLYISLEEI